MGHRRNIHTKFYTFTDEKITEKRKKLAHRIIIVQTDGQGEF